MTGSSYLMGPIKQPKLLDQAYLDRNPISPYIKEKISD